MNTHECKPRCCKTGIYGICHNRWNCRCHKTMPATGWQRPRGN